MPDNDQRSATVMAETIKAELAKDPGFAANLSKPEIVSEIADKSIAKTDGASAIALKKTEADRQLTQAAADSRVYVIAVSALSIVSIAVVIMIGFLAWPQIDPLIRALLSTPGGGQANVSARIAFSIPDGLIALGSAAIGALAGLLGPLSGGRR